MKCGAACFIVEYEENGKISRETVTARTPAAARRVMRASRKTDVTVIRVEKKLR